MEEKTEGVKRRMMVESRMVDALQKDSCMMLYGRCSYYFRSYFLVNLCVTYSPIQNCHGSPSALGSFAHGL